MNLDDAWQLYSDSGYEALRQMSSSDPLTLFYCALVGFGHDDIIAAQQFASQAAAQSPGTAVFSEAASYLQRVAEQGKQNVYINGDAFTAFINGGGNIPLYDATSAVLRQVYGQYETLDLLDVGVGNGHALLPALSPISNTLASSSHRQHFWTR